jgi:hypothetical protein
VATYASPVDLLPYQDVYANLISSALWSVLGRLASVGSDRLVDGLKTQDLVPERPQVATGIARLASAAALRDDIGGERLRAFLLSAEAREIASGIAIATLTDSKPLMDTLERRFLATFAWFVHLPEQEIASDGARLFQVIRADVADSVAAVDPSTSAGVNVLAALAPHTEQAAGQFTAFLGSRAPDFEAVFGFERKYRTAIHQRYGRLEPPNYEGATIDLDSLYVEPRFATLSALEEETLTSQDMRRAVYRTVVLGTPGAGKSTFARTFCFRHASASADEQKSYATPFLVELRDYAVRKRAGLSIVTYIEQYLSTSYQLAAPVGAVEYLLASGRAVVVFDGLDELLETHERRAIRDDVDAFAVVYPSTAILVTSRERGYWEAPLDADLFRVARILDFDNAQIEAYVNKWFALGRDAGDAQAASAAFLHESEEIADLRSNALLLALMCSIYKRQNYIPRNRAAVYEECANMLFDRWDRSRGIRVDRPVDSHLHPLLQHVAHWMFVDKSLQAGVTKVQLTEHVTQYFAAEVNDDPHEARALADRFVDFCQGRGWVLVSSGVDESDNELYAFAHRTFLEFFTAGWYAMGDMSVSALTEVLVARVLAGQWEMISQLAVQLRNRAVRNSATTVLQDITNRLDATNSTDRAKLLWFAARIYEFHVPRATLTETLATRIAYEHVDRAAATSASGADVRQAVAQLLNADVEARRVVVATFARCFTRRLATTAAESWFVADAALNLTLVAGLRSGGAQAARDVHERFWDECGGALLDAAATDERLARVLFASGHLSSERLLASHGSRWVFLPLPHPAYPGQLNPSYAFRLLSSAFAVSTRDDMRDVNERVQQVCDALVEDRPTLGEARDGAQSEWYWPADSMAPPAPGGQAEDLDVPDELVWGTALLAVLATGPARLPRGRMALVLAGAPRPVADAVQASLSLPKAPKFRVSRSRQTMLEDLVEERWRTLRASRRVVGREYPQLSRGGRVSRT